MKSHQQILSVLLYVIVFSSAALAASPALEMFNKLPEDAIFSIATGGTDSFGPAFKESSLGKIWNDPGVQHFIAEIKEPLLKMIADESGEDINFKEFAELIRLVASCPISAGAVQATDSQGKLSIYGCVLINAGKKKEALAAEIAKLESMAGEGEIISKRVARTAMHTPKDQDEVPIYWGWHEETFVVLINDERGKTIRSLRRASSRSTSSKGIDDAMKNRGDLFVVNFNFEKLVSIIEAELDADESSAEVAMVKRIFNALGLSGIRSMSAFASFDGPDLVVDNLIALSGKPAGLLAAPRPIDISAFDKVQAGAISAGAWNVDIAGVYDLILKIIETEAGPEGSQMVGSMIGAVEQQIGVKIRDGLIKSLDGPMVAYNVPAFLIPQVPNGGFVLVADLSDPALFEKNANALGVFAAGMAQGVLQIGSQEIAKGRTLHNWVVAPLAMMQIMPCWTVTEKELVIATNPQLINLALNQLDAPDRKASSIRSQDDFKKLEATLPKGVFYVRYDDSQTQLRQLHQQLQQMWPMVTMGAANAGVKLPVMLPTIEHLIKDMPASAEYGWIDESGIRAHYRGSGLQSTSMGAGGGAMGAAILMPALSRAKQAAKQTVSATNLKGLGMACHIHANDYDDKFPPTLETLIETADVSPKSLVSPQKPDGFDGASYIYIAGQGGSSPPTNILAYENPKFLGDKINVLYVDGHVAAVSRSEFEEELAKTQKQIKGSKSI